MHCLEMASVSEFMNGTQNLSNRDYYMLNELDIATTKTQLRHSMHALVLESELKSPNQPKMVRLPPFLMQWRVGCCYNSPSMVTSSKARLVRGSKVELRDKKTLKCQTGERYSFLTSGFMLIRHWCWLLTQGRERFHIVMASKHAPDLRTRISYSIIRHFV